MKVLVTAALLMVSAAAVFCAALQKCHVCNETISGEFYFVQDKARGGKFEVCTNCGNLPTRCFSCSIPVKTNFTTLADGRQLCTYCAKDSITEDEDARKVCLETRDALDRLFARFLAFPRTNLSVTFVDRFTLDSLFKSPGYGQQCTSVFGATRTLIVDGQRYIHAISILNGLSQPQLEAVAAHEFAHTWLNENLPLVRRTTLSRDAEEGFCELVAYDLMQDRNYEAEKSKIKENPYTAGQLDAFLKAESIHGFNMVLDWIKAGETAKLDPADPDGVRDVPEGKAVASKAVSSGSELPVYYSRQSTAVLPEKLLLKNISGPANRRLAIINEQTFAVNEQARLKLATTNVLIRCLEIRTNSVRIQFDTGSTEELFLSSK